MSKSNTSRQVISLPKGGGALHGMGEKFSPDLHTGTGNFSVPIALPPGRHGFQPELNLVYSTGSGNGPFGLGWNLSIPGIARKTSKGVPRYGDGKDVFILSGSEELLAVQETSSVTRYQPRTEGLFAIILHHHDASNDYWEVRSKDGLVSLYGSPAARGNDPATLADPMNRQRVFAWKLSLTRDPFGNRIEYEYDRDRVDDGSHLGAQLYLKAIRYVDYEDHGATQFLVSAGFEYEPRPDPWSEYRSGFEIRTRRRCTRVAIRTHADQPRLVRTYDFGYLDQVPLAAFELPLNGVSMLSQIKVTGHDGDRREALPPLEFGYTRFEPEKRRLLPIEGTDLPARSLADANLELVDLFGSGLPDILELNGVARYWRNLGSGRFDVPRPMRDAPAGLSLADSGVQLLDADGDGRTDLLVTTDGISGYFPLRFGGLWDRRSFQRHRVAPSFNLEDPEVKLVDLDGDGVTDAIRAGTRLECFFNHPRDGWHDTRYIERQALQSFPNINFSDPRVKWADMSGDGLQDIVLVSTGRVEYWPNLGYGAWGRPVLMRNSPQLPYGHDPRRLLVGDVDGDGLADIVCVEDTKVTLWINQSGNGWSAPIVIVGTPAVSDTAAIRLADVLGSGIGGVLWTTDAGATARAHMFFLDFTAGTKPYLLQRMDNHMGAVTRVEYAPSTRFYLEDQQRLATRWKTPLPFPVQVVSRVEVQDPISGGKLTTEYGYHHGYWDGAEREFRGFGRVDQRDSEVFSTHHSPGPHTEQHFEPVGIEMFSPPTETRTWFHQGPAGDELGDWEETDYGAEFWPEDPQVLSRPRATTELLRRLPRRARRDALRVLRGSVVRTELYALDGTQREDRPYSVTESVFGLREEAPPQSEDPERPRIFFPQLFGQRSTQWERGSDPLTQFTFSGDYDKYGQARSRLSIAVPRRRKYQDSLPPASDAEPYLATHTRTDYAQRDDARTYIVDRVSRTTTYEVPNDGRSALFALSEAVTTRAFATSSNIIAQKLSFYDGAAFEGLPWGELGPYGALTRSEELVLTEDLLRQSQRSGSHVLVPPELPAYFATNAAPLWAAEYPQAFRDALPPLAGYIFQPGAAMSPFTRGFFAPTERRRYDFQTGAAEPRGLVTVQRDSLGQDTLIEYEFELLPAKVTDAVGLETRAINDPRIFQPREVTDPNGNRTLYTFSPLGLMQSTSVLGGQGEGDQQHPSVVMHYDFLAFAERQQPVLVRTIRRTHHDTELDVAALDRDQTVTTVEYSDGFGRLLQTRTQAEDVLFGNSTFGGVVLPLALGDPATRAEVIGAGNADPGRPNVVVSGWQIYDNKGRVVEKFEPFFDRGWDYAAPEAEHFGAKVRTFYDPRGQVIRTRNPDGSEQRVIHGVPRRLDDPEVFTPTPWEAYTYDANDNAGRTHGTEPATRRYQQHWNTPTSLEIDALGRTIRTVERNGQDADTDWHTTRSSYDLRGNLLTVSDALGRLAFQHVYDLANRVLRIDSIDAGVRRTVLDAAGNELERRDSKGALILRAYDRLQRLVQLWARDDAVGRLTLRERLEYGDGGSPNQPVGERNTNRSHHLLGTLQRHYDEAGLLEFEAYDFKGSVVEKTRRVVRDEQILSVFGPAAANGWDVQAYRVDWAPLAGAAFEAHVDTLLETTSYRTSATYDALNRIKLMRYPEDVESKRRSLRPHYNRAGALDGVALDDTPYVERIAYDAKGQRTLADGRVDPQKFDPGDGPGALR